MKYSEIEIIPSLGNSGAVRSVKQNVLLLDENAWPPPDLLPKMTKSGKIRYFSEKNQAILKKELGYYTDLQSIKSEDAITWSLFGNISNMDSTIQNNFYMELLSQMNLTPDDLLYIKLWQRLPHPENGSPRGPEIDVLIIGRKRYILVECKWTSMIGAGQGIKKDKDQIQIRNEFIRKNGKSLFPQKSGEILLVGNIKIDKVKSITWDEISLLKSIPFNAEFRKYLSWKKEILENCV